MSQFCLNEKGEKKERKNDDKNKAASKYIIMCLCAYVQRTQAVTIHRHGPGFLNKNVRGREKKKKKIMVWIRFLVNERVVRTTPMITRP